MNWNFYLNFFAAMTAIVNPLAILPFWSRLTNDLDKKARKDTAYLVISTSFFILLLFFIGGKYVLSFFSIELPVFRIAGGIMLLFTGLAMIDAKGMKAEHSRKLQGKPIQAAKLRFREIIVPMAIPLLSGPGSITTVILYGNKTNRMIDFFVLSVVLILVMWLLFIVFIFSEWIEKKVDALVFNVLTRLLGILVVAIAVQFIVQGLGEVFPVLSSDM